MFVSIDFLFQIRNSGLGFLLQNNCVLADELDLVLCVFVFDSHDKSAVISISPAMRLTMAETLTLGLFAQALA